MRHVFYIVFGLGVVGVYTIAAASGIDIGGGSASRSVLPPEYRAGAYRTASPMIWRTGFHGPNAPGQEGDDDDSGGVVFFGGGYGGGK